MAKVYFLGVTIPHSTAALLCDGEILGVMTEDRFNRRKNCVSYPRESIEFLLKEFNVRKEEIAGVVLSFQNGVHYGFQISSGGTKSFYDRLIQFTYRLPLLNIAYKVLYKIYKKWINRKWSVKQAGMIASHLGIPTEKIISYPHFMNHAASVVYALDKQDDRVLVLTNDGAGDEYCASVTVYENGEFNVLAKVHNDNSLAGFYGIVTLLMGMKFNEHEFKVMGLAPYTNPNQQGVYDCLEIFRGLFSLDGIRFKSKIDAKHYIPYLAPKIRRMRFDWIAYAAQAFIEEFLCAWATNVVKETGIRDICCAGGIFMNVKANKALSELDCVDSLHVMPSAADESTAIGAAYLGYVDHCKAQGKTPDTKPLKDLYLGVYVTDDDVAAYITANNLEEDFFIHTPEDPEAEVAKLLADGKVVARFAGRMEFGQRALGNRSLLANPSIPGVVKNINDRIKSRDFWMPFAGSILDEDADEYIVNPKNLNAYYMMHSFDSTPLGQDKIPAALHPYDKTIRPQLVKKEMNPRYHHLLSRFKELTGIGAVLNTSLNLHGEPVVCSIADAFHTIRNSDLDYLQLESYIFERKEKALE